MDTDNDGAYRTFKTTLSLRRLAATGPWTWHGWQTDLEDAMRRSLTHTLRGPEPTPEDVAALLAFIDTLESPPNPHGSRSPEDARSIARGKIVFEGKGACAECHRGPHFTDGKIHDVGLGKPDDVYSGFATPSLRDVYDRNLLLHDGRAKSLEEVLTGPHAPEKVAGEPLSETERRDLIRYLKTL